MSEPSHYFSPHDGTSDDPTRTIRIRIGDDLVAVDTMGGVFSPEHLDVGTRVLLDHAPPPPPDAAHVLDLGCGWGPITLMLGRYLPDATVWAVDVNERALALTRRNAARLGIRTTCCAPDVVPASVRFDAIWSNPPIRVGKAALHDMLQHWLPRLTPTGAAALVVHKHLGADSLATWLRGTLPRVTGEVWAVERVMSQHGFRILRVTREP